MAYLSANDSVGLVLSDLSSDITESNSDSTWPVMAQLWNSIYPNNEKNLKKQDVYIKSNTTNLWYKPQALEKLLAIELDRVMEIANRDTVLIAQSFANLLPYASWANEFDFRLSVLEDLTVYETKRLMVSQQSKLLDNTSENKTNFSTIKKLASHLKMQFRGVSKR